MNTPESNKLSEIDLDAKKKQIVLSLPDDKSPRREELIPTRRWLYFIIFISTILTVFFLSGNISHLIKGNLKYSYINDSSGKRVRIVENLDAICLFKTGYTKCNEDFGVMEIFEVDFFEKDLFINNKKQIVLMNDLSPDVFVTDDGFKYFLFFAGDGGNGCDGPFVIMSSKGKDYKFHKIETCEGKDNLISRRKLKFDGLSVKFTDSIADLNKGVPDDIIKDAQGNLYKIQICVGRVYKDNNYGYVLVRSKIENGEGNCDYVDFFQQEKRLLNICPEGSLCKVSGGFSGHGTYSWKVIRDITKVNQEFRIN